MDGLNILTDPVLHSRCGADLGLGIIGPKRRVAPALAVKDLPRIDLIMMSHFEPMMAPRAATDS